LLCFCCRLFQIWWLQNLGEKVSCFTRFLILTSSRWKKGINHLSVGVPQITRVRHRRTHNFSLAHCLCFHLLADLLGGITNKYANLWKLLTLIAKFQLCCGPWSIFPAFFLFGVAFLHHWNFRIANKIWMKANCYFISDAW